MESPADASTSDIHIVKLSRYEDANNQIKAIDMQHELSAKLREKRKLYEAPLTKLAQETVLNAEDRTAICEYITFLERINDSFWCATCRNIRTFTADYLLD